MECCIEYNDLGNVLAENVDTSADTLNVSCVMQGSKRNKAFDILDNLIGNEAGFLEDRAALDYTVTYGCDLAEVFNYADLFVSQCILYLHECLCMVIHRYVGFIFSAVSSGMLEMTVDTYTFTVTLCKGAFVAQIHGRILPGASCARNDAVLRTGAAEDCARNAVCRTSAYAGNDGHHARHAGVEVVAERAYMMPSADMKSAAYLKGEDLYITALSPRKADLSEAVNLDDMIATVNYDQEWNQIFNEAWRAYRDGFYLENMHGVDWQAMHDKYAALLPYVKNRLDLTYVIGGMIGELAVGHAYVDGGDHIEADQHNIGMLGAELEQVAGGYKIKKILRGAPDRESLRSPLLEPGMNVREGDVITAIDGVSAAGVNNIYTLLRDKAGVMTELTLNDGRKVVVKPIQDEYPLYHHEWVQHNIDYVSEKTGGRVGYVYIPDMGPEGLREFSRYFFAQTDKEALIVDDRGNGGGNISPMVIERLLRQPYRMTMYRGSNYNGTVPERTLYGPKVLLVNKYSASDGDLFPWSFKENKLGPVIGTRSWGGIVGISGSLPYMDGTDIRVPFFTNYDTRGNWIVENHGVDPDIIIDNDPVMEFNGIDQQLDKAIEVILEQLKDRKPMPKTPAPRTLKDLGVE